jgi:hypothetical protein
MTLDTEIIVALITFAGTISARMIKIIVDNSARNKRERERDERDKARDERDKKIRELRIESDDLRRKRDESYDDYDIAAKDLTLAHAVSYVTGNDRKKLSKDIKGMQKAKKAFKESNKDYYSNLESLTAQMREA